MAEPSSSAPSAGASSTSTFNLKVVSPTFPVPLSFSHLPIDTSVRQLKEKITAVVPPNHANDVQRLIHQGRLLARDDDTMVDVFGHETLRSTDSQTIHLVLRPQDGAAYTSQASNVPAGAVAAAASQVGQERNSTTFSGADTATAALAQPAQPSRHPFLDGEAVLEPPPQLPPSLANLAHHQQLLHNHQLAHMENHNRHLAQQLMPSVQRLHELQAEGERLQQELLASSQRFRDHVNSTRPGNSPANGVNFAAPHNGSVQHGPGAQAPGSLPIFQNIVGQFQRDRATVGPNGVQSSSRAGTPQPVLTQTSAIHSAHGHHHHHHHQRPEQTRSFRQEGVGPNGERWQVTVNETTTIIPNSHTPQPRASPAPDNQLSRDVQNIIRGGDLYARQQHLQQTLQRSRQGTPQPGIIPSASNGLGNHQGGMSGPNSVTVPIINAANTPTIGSRAQSQHRQPGFQSGAAVDGSPQPPMVYILSSPQGPRALLISGVDSYYTPRAPSVRSRPAGHQVPNAIQNQMQNILNQGPAAVQNAQGQWQVPPPAVGIRNMGQIRHQRVANPVQGLPHVQAAPAGHAAPVVQDIPVDAPRPAANNNLAAQVAPHIWLLIRLLGFVWFFLSGDRSWYRWITIIGLATVVFLANVGIFNGVAAQIWAPLRGHLETLLPLAPPPRIEPIGVGAVEDDDAGDAGQVAGGPRRGRRPEPNPAEVATRLLEQRRQRRNNTWLMQQLRRAEHAMLLFFASLVPGVGERHIMARAEQENAVLEAERQRRAAEEERQRRAAEEERQRVQHEASTIGASPELVNQIADGETDAATTARETPSDGLRQRPHADHGEEGINRLDAARPQPAQVIDA